MHNAPETGVGMQMAFAPVSVHVYRNDCKNRNDCVPRCYCQTVTVDSRPQARCDHCDCRSMCANLRKCTCYMGDKDCSANCTWHDDTVSGCPNRADDPFRPMARRALTKVSTGALVAPVPPAELKLWTLNSDGTFRSLSVGGLAHGREGAS